MEAVPIYPDWYWVNIWNFPHFCEKHIAPYVFCKRKYVQTRTLISVWFQHRDRLCLYVKGPRICEGLLLTFKTWLVTCVVWCLQKSSRWYSESSSGCFLKWWYPKNTPKWSFLVGKPMVVGYHHFRKHPSVAEFFGRESGYHFMDYLQISQMLTQKFFTREGTFAWGQTERSPSFHDFQLQVWRMILKKTYVIWLKKNESL